MIKFNVIQRPHVAFLELIMFLKSVNFFRNNQE